MKKYIALMLFVFTVTHGRSQYDNSIQPLKEKLSQSKEDTGRINLQIQIGSFYLNSFGILNNIDTAYSFLNQAIQLSIKLNKPDLQNMALEEMALGASLEKDFERAIRIYYRVIEYYHQTGQFAKEAKAWCDLGERYGHFHDSKYMNETIGYFQKARSLYLQYNQPLEAARILADIAGIRSTFKQFDTAEIELMQVLTQYKEAGYRKLQPIYRDLYDLHRAKGNYYRAMAYLMEAIKSMSVESDTRQAASYYELAAECNIAVKKYEEAIGWIRKSMEIYKSAMHLELLLAQVLITLNRTDEAWLLLKKYSNEQPSEVESGSWQLNWTLALYYNKINSNEQAIRHYLKAIAINDNDPKIEYLYNDWSVKCNNGVAEIYLKISKPANAEKYLKSTAYILKHAKTSLDPVLLVDYFGLQYKYDMATGNHAAAVKNLERKIQIQDSLFTADKDKQLAELNIQYETAQKEQSIKNLQIQTTAQQAEMKNANLQRNITIAGILVMIVVSLLFYRNYQQKKKANTIISDQNSQLQHLVSEKEWLLKEVHHRVKNNLQTIISLLQSQAMYLSDDALQANQISKNRIYAMSLIHQQLYKTEDMKSIDMAVFLPELLDNLAESFGTERKIKFSRAISPVRLGISQAIPVALIINEAVTNAIKYAFPDDRSGRIDISMHRTGEAITLVVADDGIGIDPAIIGKETNSLGMKLLNGLTEDIDGAITIENNHGTTISIEFKPDPMNGFNSFSA